MFMGCENGSLFILHIECYWAQFSSNLVLVQPLKGRGDSKLLYSAACNVCQLLVGYYIVNHAWVLGSCISTTWLGPSVKNWDSNLFWGETHCVSSEHSSSDSACVFCALTVLKQCRSCNGQVYLYQLAPRTVSEITCIFLGHGLWISVYIHLYIKWKLQYDTGLC